MKSDLAPNHVEDIIPFTVATCEHLEKSGSSEPRGATLGSIFKDGQLAWLSNGTSIEVVSTRTGERHATWEFGLGQAVGSTVTITCIDKFEYENSWKLVIGTDAGPNGGSVCIFDVKTSRITRSIAIPEKVTSLTMVSTAGGVNHLNWMLSDKLRYFYGIVAVGTSEGCIYLVDLVLELEGRSDESSPAQTDVITRHTPNIPAKREELLGQNVHLALLLNDGCFTQEHYYYKTPDNSISKMLAADDTCVSSINYIMQTACLAVGFNFGGFQVWTLDKLQLAYASPFLEDQLPVIRFAFQEPENDPRNFCYVWVVNGSSLSDPSRDGTCFASLYSLTFGNKTYVRGMGYCYQDVQTCLLRFDFDLCDEPGSALASATMASRLVTCCAIKEDTAHHHAKNRSLEGSLMVQEDSSRDLCVFVWESTMIDQSVRPRATLAIFDLNQWYLAQMPSQLSTVRTTMCPYIAFLPMEEISEKAAPDFFLDVYVPPRSICRMQSAPNVEQLFYPSALALDASCLLETGIINATFLGLQRQIIFDLKSGGPAMLANPRETFNRCIMSSLIGHQKDPDFSSSSFVLQRDAILTLALEQNLVDFLISCMRQWSEGLHNQDGCTLRFLQEWAWKRVTFIKLSLDRQCTSLYDCSGLRLDASAIHFLHHQATQLKHLEFIFKALLVQSVPTTDQGLRDLESKTNVITLLTLHLEVVLWFVNFDLLPENAESETCSVGVAYPYTVLARIYSSRRAGLRRLSGAFPQSDLLLIDGLVSHVGEPLQSLWTKEGGNGLYPPPSLHALLNVYLLDEVDTPTKYRIVQYLFLDLAELLGDDHHIVQHLVKFPSAFSLSPSLIKVTQGFWLLDHKDYEEAVSALLHPIISPTDILPWQHLRIMKAFLYQGEAQKALRYAKVRKPALYAADEVRFYLTLLLANGLVPEAYHYQKENRDESNAEDLLQHFFLGAQQTKHFGDLLKLSFCPFEEYQLTQFLQNSPEPQAKELLVVYYIQRSRYVDAMRLNEQLAPRMMHEADPAARERAATLDVIVEGFSRVLPKVQSQLTQSVRNIFGPGKRIWQQHVPRPRPLSTCVRSSQSQPMSKAVLIGTVMEKIAQIWAKPPADFSPLQAATTPRSKRKSCDQHYVSETIPLVCTPSISRARGRSGSVVFPTLMGKDGDTPSGESSLYHMSPMKKTRYLDVSPARHGDSSVERRGHKYFCTEALSLLQTPPVRRKTPIGKLSVATTSAVPSSTPQSILKVRTATSSPLPSAIAISCALARREGSVQPSLPSTPGLPEISSHSTASSSFEETFTEVGRSGLRQLRFGASSSDDEGDAKEDVVTRDQHVAKDVLSIPDNEPRASPRPPLHSSSPVEMESRLQGESVDDDVKMEEEEDEMVIVDDLESSFMISSKESLLASTIVTPDKMSPRLPSTATKPTCVSLSLQRESAMPTSPAKEHNITVANEGERKKPSSIREVSVSPGDRGTAAASSLPPTTPDRGPSLPASRSSIRGTPCMPPAGLDLGELDCDSRGEEEVLVRRQTSIFPASFSTLLDQTIPSFLEGVPCAVEKELALSSLSTEQIPTKCRFLTNPSSPEHSLHHQMSTPLTRLEAKKAEAGSSTVKRVEHPVEEDVEVEDVSSFSTESSTSYPGESSNCSSDVSETDSSLARDRRGHAAGSRRRIRTLSQVVADMAENPAAPPPVREKESIEPGDKSTKVEGRDWKFPEDEVLSVSSSGDSDSDEESLHLELEEIEIEEGESRNVSSIFEELPEQQGEADREGGGEIEVIQDKEIDVVPLENIVPLVSKPSRTSPRKSERSLNLLSYSSQQQQRATLSIPSNLTELHVELDTDEAGKEATLPLPTTEYQSSAGREGDRHIPELPKESSDGSVSVIQTRSRTRKQSGSTVSSLSPRQISPGSKRSSPTSMKGTPPRPKASGPTLTSPATTSKDQLTHRAPGQRSQPPSSPTRTLVNPATSRPVGRPRRKPEESAATPRSSTPLREPTNDVGVPVETIAKPANWKSLDPRSRSSSADSDKTVEMAYETEVFYPRGHPLATPIAHCSRDVHHELSEPPLTQGRYPTRASSRMSSTRSESAEPPVEAASSAMVERSPKRHKSSPKAISKATAAPTLVSERTIETRSRFHADSIASAADEDVVEVVVKGPLRSSAGPKSKKLLQRKSISVTPLASISEPKPAAARTSQGSTSKQFSFSKPTIVAEEDEDHASLDEPKTPPNTFIFSPPLTRSRSHKLRKPSRDEESSDSVPGQGKTPDERMTQIRARPPKTPRLEQSSTSKSQTPISFNKLTAEEFQPEKRITPTRKKSLRQSIVARAHRTLIQTRRSARFQ